MLFLKTGLTQPVRLTRSLAKFRSKGLQVASCHNVQRLEHMQVQEVSFASPFHGWASLHFMEAMKRACHGFRNVDFQLVGTKRLDYRS